MNDISIIYEEVYEILKQFDKKTINRIPINILDKFNKERNKNYKSRIDKNNLFNENNIEKETLDILLYIDLNYIASKDEKDFLLKRYLNNQKKMENKEPQYNSASIFIKKQLKEKYLKEQTNIIKYKNKNFFQKIIDKVKYIIKKN